MNQKLRRKHLGDTIRTSDLKKGRLPDFTPYLKVPVSGKLVRKDNGTLCVAFCVVKKVDGLFRTYWVYEQSKESSMEQWAACH